MHTIQLNYQTVPNLIMKFCLIMVQLVMSIRECQWDLAQAQLCGNLIQMLFSAVYLTVQAIKLLWIIYCWLHSSKHCHLKYLKNLLKALLKDVFEHITKDVTNILELNYKTWVTLYLSKTTEYYYTIKRG